MTPSAKHVRQLAAQIADLASEIRAHPPGPGDGFVIPAFVDLTLREIRSRTLEALCVMETAGWSTGDDGEAP